jgi:hypothetical protein
MFVFADRVANASSVKTAMIGAWSLRIPRGAWAMMGT